MTTLKKCTAQYFTDTWKKYDADGNGYIEGSELKNFLTELAKKEPTETDISDFLGLYDKNEDGKIDMKELAAVLNPEENFLLLIRTSSHGSPNSVEFKKIWNKYDADNNGFINSTELKEFLKDAYASCGKPLDDDTLQKYTDAVLGLYDRDGNGMLDFNEMLKLLPLGNNALKGLQFDKLSEEDFKTTFARYDQNNDNSIAGEELDKLLQEMLQKEDKEANPDTLASLKDDVLKHCDINEDGKITLAELKMLATFKR